MDKAESFKDAATKAAQRGKVRLGAFAFEVDLMSTSKFTVKVLFQRKDSEAELVGKGDDGKDEIEWVVRRVHGGIRTTGDAYDLSLILEALVNCSVKLELLNAPFSWDD